MAELIRAPSDEWPVQAIDEHAASIQNAGLWQHPRSYLHCTPVRTRLPAELVLKRHQDVHLLAGD